MLAISVGTASTMFPGFRICPTDEELIPYSLLLPLRKPSETPQSKKQKSGSKTKEVTSFNFDSENPPKSVSWVQMDSSADMWAPFVNGSMVPETQKQEWDVVFSSVSKLKGRNTQTGK